MEPFRERLPVCHRSARYHFEWNALARSMPYSACKRFAYFTTLNLFLKALGKRRLARKHALFISSTMDFAAFDVLDPPHRSITHGGYQELENCLVPSRYPLSVPPVLPVTTGRLL